MMDKKKTTELTDTDLDEVSGGVGLLLPAVQKVHEQATSSSRTAVKIKLPVYQSPSDPDF